MDSISDFTWSEVPVYMKSVPRVPHNCTAPNEAALGVGMFVTFFVTVVGSTGNLLTLCTLAHQFYMPRRHRYIKYLTPDTILIGNLALADLFYSSINLPFVFVTYYRLYSDRCPWEGDFDEIACKISAFLRYMNAISEWMTLGLMALERCVNIYKFRANRSRSKWFTKRRTILYCCLIWAFGFLCQLPTLLKVFGEFGYNDDYVKCDFIDAKKKGINPRIVFFAMESVVPCILILIGYIVILIQVYSSSSKLLSFFVVSKGNTIGVDLRRSRSTKMISMLLFVYLFCVIPICAYNIAVEENAEDYKEIGIYIYCLYWCQYFINNLIYCVSNEKYRNAYHQFLALVTFREVPLPPIPAHLRVTKRHTCPIFSISSSKQHLAPDNFRCRTISEFEERHLSMLAGDYEVQESNAGSISLNGTINYSYLDSESPELDVKSIKQSPSPNHPRVTRQQGRFSLPLSYECIYSNRNRT